MDTNGYSVYTVDTRVSTVDTSVTTMYPPCIHSGYTCIHSGYTFIHSGYTVDTHVSTVDTPVSTTYPVCIHCVSNCIQVYPLFLIFHSGTVSLNVYTCSVIDVDALLCLYVHKCSNLYPRVSNCIPPLSTNIVSIRILNLISTFFTSHIKWTHLVYLS